ncbi:MAG TPA: restriction endonuclease subunit S [Nitrosomonas sp.]|uniref:Type I restriction enzyme, S subunit n=1 Tax=Nitrosomonas ureae TaxID=44577 RepID=A0A286A8A9_9PROT|nr:type I restriction enzyme, S subunit [Nitrosomonas ureae]HRB20782.1 restriction endonuclease subunit S [Nitrosomonas sp.]
MNKPLNKSLSIDKRNWTKVKLGDVVAEPRDTVKDFASEQIEHVVGLEHIDSEDIHLRRSASMDSSTTFTKKFSAGDVLFGRRRAYLKKAAQAKFSGICSGDITVMRAKEDLLPELLPFVVNNDKFFDYAVKHSAGGLSPRVKFKDLAHYEFLLPPKEQQEKLAELFVSLSAVLEQSLFLLKNNEIYIESLVENNLTSTRVGGILNDYCSNDGIRIGPFGSLLHASDYQSEGVPVVMPADIVDGVINEKGIARISNKKAEELANYRLKENDILFPRRGDLTKRAIVLNHQENWICGTGTIRVRVNESVNSRTVFYAVTSKSTNNWLCGSSVGTTMQNINASAIKKIPFHLPKGAEAQKTLRDIESAIAASICIKNHITSSENLKKSLIHQIF